jgi:16S rRNA U516 pseudouridylate synthase RsuA-like enzyme
MKRTTVFLTEDQIRQLRKAAKHKGVDVAQLIRIYVSAGLDKEKP